MRVKFELRLASDTRMINKRLGLIALVVSIFASGCRVPVPPPIDRVAQQAENRRTLFREIQPVKLANCELERFGDAGDGGYLMCRNLMGRAGSVYSYGIAGTDNWGCAVSARLKLPVHQYDCFNVTRPPCGGATPMFHEECVGPARVTEEGRLFDTIESQITKNGDAGKRLIMKMDVEGAEWTSFMATPESVLKQIDQLSVEFHGVEEARFVETIQKLKTVFHVVNVHYNNWTCHPDTAPLPALAYEILFVNKDLGVVDPSGTPVVPNPLDAPNNKDRPDCQKAPPITP
jgi:hypothetical protein